MSLPLRNISIGLASIALISAAALPALAARDSTTNTQRPGIEMRMPEVSDEAKALLDAMKEARSDGDTEKVAELREQMKALRETEQAAREAAMDTAIAGGYVAWKAYAEEQNMPSEFIEKITEANFQTFVELHATQKKVRALQQQLGLDTPSPLHGGMGGKMHGGMGGGKHGRMMDAPPADAPEAPEAAQ